MRNGLTADAQRIGCIGHPVTVVTSEGTGGVKAHCAEGLVNRIREVHLLALPAAEEKRLVFPERAADFKAILVQLDQRLLATLCIGVEFLRVQRRVAEEFECRAVELVGTRTGRDGNVGSGVATFFCGRVRGCDLKLLHVVRVQPEDVAGRVGVGGFVGFNTVDGDVGRAGARAVHVDGVARTLHYTGFIHQQV